MKKINKKQQRSIKMIHNNIVFSEWADFTKCCWILFILKMMRAQTNPLIHPASKYASIFPNTYTHTKDMPINVNDDHSTEYCIFTSRRIHLKCTLFHCINILLFKWIRIIQQVRYKGFGIRSGPVTLEPGDCFVNNWNWKQIV